MKVIIFGSTGTIGRHLIKQSLEEGYLVTAFCRDVQKLNEVKHPNLIIEKGDVLNLKDVTNAVKNQNVVIIALGSGKNRKGVIRSVGTKNIISAMKLNGVSRLICQSTLGTGKSTNNLNFFWKHIMFGWYLKQVLLDHELQEKYVLDSNLNWTIIRPAAFTDGERTGNYLHGFSTNDKSIKLKISRADVADFILKQITNQSYLLKTPGVSY
ncbi:MAG: NAD(P)-binding oxidoreductase [Cellulophaga sp.]